NISYLFDFKELNGGYVAFGGNLKGGKISGKATKGETSPILKTFITGIENQLSLKVKIIRSDNETKFKNNDLNQFSEMQGIKREVSVPRTPQQNGIIKRKNRTLIEAARTMLADLLLLILFWTEAVNTACYVQNRVLVTKPQNKTPYVLGRTPSIGFMRHFGCPVTILNTLDPLGKFDGKVNEGFLVGYSVSSKAFRVFNSRTQIVQETLHINFLENKPNVVGEENVQQYVLFPVWSFGSNNSQNTDGDVSFEVKEPEFKGSKPQSEVQVSPSKLEDITYSDDEEDVDAEADFTNLETTITVSPILTTRVHKDQHQMDVKSAFLYGIIEEELYVCQPPRFEDPNYPDKVYKVVKALYGLHQAPRAWYETLAIYLLENGFQRGKIDQTLFIKRQKSDILLVQIYVDAIIFGSTNKDLCKAFKKLMKDKFQMSSMGERTFFLGLQVKQKQVGIFITQDKYVAEILRKFSLTDRKSASTPIDTKKPLLKDPDGEDVDVHTYRSMIGSLMYLTSSRPDIMFAVYACARFQVTPKASYLHAVKRIFRYLKGKRHLGLWYPKDSPFNLVAYSDSDYPGASLDRKSTTGGCQFLGCRLISWQCKKQIVVAISSTKAEYVVVHKCYGFRINCWIMV
nr:uncharacterized mitochondrial protein AtMg00810-like [Tanacetum cinerariifolium]